LLDENLARLGVQIAKIVCHDWMKSAVPPEIPSAAPFDRILIDAPCTNTGVMRRRVDVRWRLKPADFNRMHTRQIEITHAVIPLLKPGGILVYSTCSLEREEMRTSFNRCSERCRSYSSRKKGVLFLFRIISTACSACASAERINQIAGRRLHPANSME